VIRPKAGIGTHGPTVVVKAALVANTVTKDRASKAKVAIADRDAIAARKAALNASRRTVSNGRRVRNVQSVRRVQSSNSRWQQWNKVFQVNNVLSVARGPKVLAKKAAVAVGVVVAGIVRKARKTRISNRAVSNRVVVTVTPATARTARLAIVPTDKRSRLATTFNRQ
jgi:hypothetical protein